MLNPVDYFVTASGNTRVRIGSSSCLLGDPVRYDGKHKRQAHWLALAGPCELIPHCPEVADSLGVPRPQIELVSSPVGIRALGVAPFHRDVTDLLSAAAVTHCRQLRQLDDGKLVDGHHHDRGQAGLPLTGSAELEGLAGAIHTRPQYWQTVRDRLLLTLR